jgi:hypothetical protein
LRFILGFLGFFFRHDFVCVRVVLFNFELKFSRVTMMYVVDLLYIYMGQKVGKAGLQPCTSDVRIGDNS